MHAESCADFLRRLTPASVGSGARVLRKPDGELEVEAARDGNRFPGRCAEILLWKERCCQEELCCTTHILLVSPAQNTPLQVRLNCSVAAREGRNPTVSTQKPG